MINHKTCLLIICLSGFLPFIHAQHKTVGYSIISKNDSVGNMLATQKISGEDVVYSVSSVVEMRMLLTIKVNIHEEAHYHKDKLMASSSKRIVNDKTKGNKQTKAAGDGYILMSEEKESRLNQKNISYDFLRLYFKEPVAVGQIFSDYYQKMLTIKSISNHTYRIHLPEGGYNTYYYENGACHKVDIHGTLFNFQMVLQR